MEDGSSSSRPSSPNALSATESDTNDLDEFQMYQRFRLKMVSMFGSLASALYEFGADEETGRISQERFVEICCDKLEVLNEKEANKLFVHFTNADPLDNGVGGYATFHHFSISDQEWNDVVARKKQAATGGRLAMPFSSAASGGSAGIYHRAINVKTAHTPRGSSGSRLKQSNDRLAVTPRSAGASASGFESIQEAGSRRTPSKRERRIYPWRQPQKPWAPSVLAGQNMIAEAKTATRFRPCEQTFKTSRRVERTDAPPLRESCVRKGDVGYTAALCPPRRQEMEPRVCPKQVTEWWPYKNAPTPRSKLDLTRSR